MFEVNSATERYTTYYLIDRTTDSRVSVVPERGGMVTGVQMGNRQLLYLDRERFTHPDLSVRGGIPILFPICGNLPNNRYTWKGQTYELPQHGFGRTLPWSVTSTDSDRDAALTLTLKHTRETLSVYPFEFKLNFTYRWGASVLSLEQQFCNHSDEVMPFSIGFHPYFAVDNKALLQFELPTRRYYDRANDIATEFLGTWETDLAEIDAAFEPIDSGQPLEAKVSDRDWQVKISADAYFRHLVFWTVDGKPFFCLEPWSAPRNAINTAQDLLLLEPGAELKTLLSIEFRVNEE